jgi:hypothetical protein
VPPSFFKIDFSPPHGRLLCVSIPWRRTAPFIGVRLSALLRDVLNAPFVLFILFLAAPRPARQCAAHLNRVRVSAPSSMCSCFFQPCFGLPTAGCSASRTVPLDRIRLSGVSALLRDVLDAPSFNTARGLLHLSDATGQTLQVMSSLFFPRCAGPYK